MTVGKLTTLCWVVFGVMCVAFMPLVLAVDSISWLPGPARVVLDVFVVAGLWWGPFVYGMYLAQAVMGNGDRRLLKRGIRGTAVVLEATTANLSLGGNPETGRLGRQVYRYHLRVTLPDRRPYETYASIATRGISKGETVPIAASRYNRKRVTIDVGQGATKGYAPATMSHHSKPAEHDRRRPAKGHEPQVQRVRNGPPRYKSVEDDVPQPIEDDVPPGYQASGHRGSGGGNDNSARLRQLAELGRLHKDGVLTDAEFAAEKARILNQ